MKYYLLLLAISFCFGCDRKTELQNVSDNVDSIRKKVEAKSDFNQRSLDTILLNAKFNNLQLGALLGMVTYRFKNRDSLMYYLGQADALSKARKIIIK